MRVFCAHNCTVIIIFIKLVDEIMTCNVIYFMLKTVVYEITVFVNGALEKYCSYKCQYIATMVLVQCTQKNNEQYFDFQMTTQLLLF
jgi:hypothetical protein